MKDIFFSAIFLLTFFSCSEEQPNDALSYNDIGAIPNVVSKTEPEDILILDTLAIDFNSDLFQNISGLKIDSLQPLSKKSILDRGQHLNSNKTIVFIKDSSFEYKEWLWAGVSYRHKDAVVGMVGLNINRMFKFGYSYDFNISRFRSYSAGGHELVLGIMLGR